MNKKTALISLFSLFLILLAPSLSAIEYSVVSEAKEQYVSALQQERGYLNFEFSLFFRLVPSIIYLLLAEGVVTITNIFLLLLMNFIMIEIPFFTTVFGQILIGLSFGCIGGMINELLYNLYDKWTDNHFKDFPKVGDFLDTLMILLNIPAFWVAYRIVIPR